MTPVKDLRIRARGVIEKGWCQGAYAKDADGERVYAGSTDATSFCIRGAVFAVCPTDYPVRVSAYTLLENVVEKITQSPGASIADYNDAPDRTYAEVLAVFDAAITLADSPT